MGAIVSSLFRVMCFMHEGRVVQLVDQLSFHSSQTPNSKIPFLTSIFVQVMSHQSPVLHLISASDLVLVTKT